MLALLGTVRDHLSKIVDATCVIARLSSLPRPRPSSRLSRVLSRQFCTKVDLTLSTRSRALWLQATSLRPYLETGRQAARFSRCRSREVDDGLTRPMAISIALACMNAAVSRHYPVFQCIPRLCARFSYQVRAVCRSLAQESREKTLI